jgi:putative (di)nucleoside polyphosphate hydrolase
MVVMGGKLGLDSRCSLGELLVDPLIQLIMKADNVDAAHIEALYRRIHAPDGDSADRRRLGRPVGEVAICPVEDAHYRSGVGIMLLNPRNEVFVGQRVGGDGGARQMPQGGIDPGERPYAAALRELREEIGTDDAEMLARSNVWLRYDLPPELVGKAWGGRWRGQQRKGFVMRFRGADANINIATEHPEFSAWRWMPAAQAADLIVAFKRQLYLDVLREFHGIHTAECQ